MDELSIKVNKLNLLHITPSLEAYISEVDPSWISNGEIKEFEYAKFLNGHVFLYTKTYIENITVDQFNKEFVEAVYLIV